jgi:hypothetical protein
VFVFEPKRPDKLMVRALTINKNPFRNLLCRLLFKDTVTAAEEPPPPHKNKNVPKKIIAV